MDERLIGSLRQQAEAVGAVLLPVCQRFQRLRLARAFTASIAR